jgi:hypothetical protein
MAFVWKFRKTSCHPRYSVGPYSAEQQSITGFYRRRVVRHWVHPLHTYYGRKSCVLQRKLYSAL